MEQEIFALTQEGSKSISEKDCRRQVHKLFIDSGLEWRRKKRKAKRMELWFCILQGKTAPYWRVLIVLGSINIRGSLGFADLKSAHSYQKQGERHMGSALKGVVSGYRDKRLTSSPTGELTSCGGWTSERNKCMKSKVYPGFHGYFLDLSNQKSMIERNLQM